VRSREAMRLAGETACPTNGQVILRRMDRQDRGGGFSILVDGNGFCRGRPPGSWRSALVGQPSACQRPLAGALLRHFVAQALLPAASALLPTLTFGTVSRPRTGVETSLDTAGKSACATLADGVREMRLR